MFGQWPGQTKPVILFDRIGKRHCLIFDQVIVKGMNATEMTVDGLWFFSPSQEMRGERGQATFLNILKSDPFDDDETFKVLSYPLEQKMRSYNVTIRTIQGGRISLTLPSRMNRQNSGSSILERLFRSQRDRSGRTRSQCIYLSNPPPKSPAS